MYYKEEIINGVLCFKTTPNGEWRQFTLEKLTERIVSYSNRILFLENELNKE